MIENSAAGRAGTTDEIAAAAAYLLGLHAAFVTASDLLIDGGVIAPIRRPDPAFPLNRADADHTQQPRDRTWPCRLVVPGIVLEEASSNMLQAVAFALNVVIWIGFAAELAFVLAVTSNRARTLRAHWLDAASSS